MRSGPYTYRLVMSGRRRKTDRAWVRTDPDSPVSRHVHSGYLGYTEVVGKVLVSFEDTLLRRIDRRAAAFGVSRSGYLATLAERDLAEVEGQGGDPVARRALGRLDRVLADTPAGDSTRLVREARDAR